MTTIRNDRSIADRYSSAARFTGPKVCATIPGLSVYGYWLDEHSYYFRRELLDSESKLVVARPAVFDTKAGSANDIIAPEDLAAILAAYAGEPVDVALLNSAAIDMPDARTLGVSLRDTDYLIDVNTRSVLNARRSPREPCLYSPNGRYACFVRGFNVWVRDLQSGSEIDLTGDGEPLCAYGHQSETALAAVSYRRHPFPLGLWSPDSEWFLTHRIDDRSLPDIGLIEHVPANSGRPITHTFKYVMPNDPLPITTYVAIHVPTRKVTVFDGFPVPHICFSPFTFRMAWHSGTATAWSLAFDRYFKRADLLRLDLERGTARVAISERTDSGYLNLHPLFNGAPNVRTLPSSGRAIWYSERSGWGHLYMHDLETGEMITPLTSGDWMVRDIVHVDERRQTIYFTASGIDAGADPTRRNLCSVKFDGSGLEIICRNNADVSVPKTLPGGLGQHAPFRPSYSQPGVSPDARFAVLRSTTVSTGNATSVIGLHSTARSVLASAAPPQRSPRATHFEVRAADTNTPLHGILILPSDFDPSKRYPVIDFIYPGPSVLQQPHAYGTMGATFASALAELGFAVVMVDTRNMPIGRRELNQIGYGQLLEPQLADHAATIRHLCAGRAFLDIDRVGIIGLSGGGAAAARAMFDYGSLYKAGVSVCGNHDSSLYCAVWSDRYRGPGDTAKWRDQSNNSAAHKLEGKLLLISGDMDENVHLSHTLSLADALINANRDFDLLIVPNGGHLVMMTSGYVQRRIWDFFVRSLLQEQPPTGFDLTFTPHEIDRLIAGYMHEAWNS